MSVPWRIPPSTNIFIRPWFHSTILSNTSAVAGVWSRTLPPWLDTTIALAPASNAFFAPDTVIIPFTMNGIPAALTISPSCSTVLLPAGGLRFLRNGSPAASISMATAKALLSFTIFILSATISLLHGFTVGTPAPPASLMAFVAATITLASIPSPVKAAMPFSAQAFTRILLYCVSS